MFGFKNNSTRDCKDASNIHILEIDIENIFYGEFGAVARVCHNGICFEAPASWFESTSKEGNYKLSPPCSISVIEGWHSSIGEIDKYDTFSTQFLEIVFSDNLDKTVSPSYFKKVLENSETNLVKRTRNGIQTYFKETSDGPVKYDDKNIND